MVVSDRSDDKPKKKASNESATGKRIQKIVPKKVSSSFSSGGGGVRFESQALASFVALMLTKSNIPVLNGHAMKITPQAKRRGYNIDDFVVTVEDISKTSDEKKLLCCVKHTIAVTDNNPGFFDFVKSAWLDYNNESFQKRKDSFALITRSLSKTDKEVLALLDFAKQQTDSVEFLMDLKIKGFMSECKRSKYKVLCNHITKANEGKIPTDEVIHDFLRHMHIIELDFSHSCMNWIWTLNHLAHYCERPEITWSALLDYVGGRKTSGADIMDNIPEEMIGHFSKIKIIPPELLGEQYDEILANPENIEVLAIMGLIGSWDSRIDRWQGDAEAIREFVNKIYSGGFSEWEKKVKQMRFSDVSLVTFNNGIWALKDRSLLTRVAKGIFDNTLDAFSKLILSITSERDPALDLSPDQRFAAQAYGKQRRFSETLRRSVLESFAILANNKDILSNCSDKKNNFADETVHSIMDPITWESICSLNGLMQPIAEASPKIFLNSLEKAIRKDSELFLRVQEQSGTSFTGRNYICDVLWALEALAWDPEFLPDVTSLLGSLVKTYRNQTGTGPFNSLTEIFLPWCPHTTATIEKRIETIGMLYDEFPDVAWELILNLISSNYTSSFGTMKPKWRETIGAASRKKTSPEEYWDQIRQYVLLAVETVKDNPVKMISLIGRMHNMPPDVIDAFIEMLLSTYATVISDKVKIGILKSLEFESRRNRRNPDAGWVMGPEHLQKLDAAIAQIKSDDPGISHKTLFSMRDFEMYENDDYKEERERIHRERTEAVKWILEEEGVDGIIKLSSEVCFPEDLGYSLGSIDDEYFTSFLPKAMGSADDEFIRGYIVGRFQKKKWDWGVFSHIDSWDSMERVRFLYSLPFSPELFAHISNLSDEEVELYWKNIKINPWAVEDEYVVVVDSLMKVGRINDSVDILYSSLYREKGDGPEVDANLVIKVLTSLVALGERASSADSHHILELINKVQKDSNTSIQDKASIEWMYLDILDGLQGHRPVILESQLSQDPRFFCEIIRLIYKSEGGKEKISENMAPIALQAYKLLNRWKIPPGADNTGGFDAKKFKEWLQAVREIAKGTGHLSVAMSSVGEVLVNVPKDDDGFWINKEVAEILNEVDSDELRAGLHLGFINSTGVYAAGAGFEKNMADKFRKRVLATEKLGYRRLASCMKDLEKFWMNSCRYAYDVRVKNGGEE